MSRIDASVVICAYNEEGFIRGAVESVFVQETSRRWELIVIDDGSTDATAAEVRSALRRAGDAASWTYARITHAGLSVARNAGIQLASGRVVVFLDADAVAEPDWLERIVSAFDQEGVVGAGGAIKILNRGSAFARLIDCFHHRRAYDCADDRVPIIGANMAFLREVLERVGGFRAPFVSRGDDDSIRHAVEPSGRLVFVPGAAIRHTRPGSWSDWLSERRANGKARVLVDQYIDAHPVSAPRGISRATVGRLRSSYHVLLVAGAAAYVFVKPVGAGIMIVAVLAALSRAVVYFGRGVPGALRCAREHGLDSGGYFLRTAAVALASTWLNDWSYAKAIWLNASVDWASTRDDPVIREKHTGSQDSGWASTDHVGG